MTCCKSCRVDFLELFAAWRRGNFVSLRDKIEEFKEAVDCIYEENSKPSVIAESSSKKLKRFFDGFLKKWW